jgi:NAD(P)-dependent dehydrogenase (short-subunit alcohol dehydrogenase family)
MVQEIARAEVVVASRGQPAVDETTADICKSGGTAIGIVAMSQPDTAEQLVQAAIGRFGKIDILVNIAGGQGRRVPFDGLTDQESAVAPAPNAITNRNSPSVSEYVGSGTPTPCLPYALGAVPPKAPRALGTA